MFLQIITLKDMPKFGHTQHNIQLTKVSELEKISGYTIKKKYKKF